MATTNDTNIFGYSNVLRGDIPGGGGSQNLKVHRKTFNFKTSIIPNFPQQIAEITIPPVEQGQVRYFFNVSIKDKRGNSHAITIPKWEGKPFYNTLNYIETFLENGANNLFISSGWKDSNNIIVMLNASASGGKTINWAQETYNIVIEWFEYSNTV